MLPLLTPSRVLLQAPLPASLLSTCFAFFSSFFPDVVNDSSLALGGTFPPAPWWPPGPHPTNLSSLGEQPWGLFWVWVLCTSPPCMPLTLGRKLSAILTLLPAPELEPRGQQPVAKAEGSPTAILIGCLVAIILLLLLIIALMLWRLHWRRLLSKVGGWGGVGLRA